jgi:hypothetical protein
VTKICNKCGKEKSFRDFNRNSRNKTDGRRGRCKACTSEDERVNHHKNPELRRWRVIKCRYGIDKTDYLKLLAEQKNVCAICGEPGETRQNKGERYLLHIDHDHETGEIRGLLCFRCNNGIGLLNSPEVLMKASNYLRGDR